MQFLKKHYEKIVLSVVLLGLAVAAAALPILVSSVQQSITETVEGVKRTKPKLWVPLDFSTNQAIVRRIEGPFKVAFSGPEHNLFNPVKWIRRPDGRVTKDNHIGATALRFVRAEPLDLQVKFEGVVSTGDKLQYTLSILNEKGAAASKPIQASAAINVKQQNFTILKVDGPADAPESLLVMLAGEKEPITVGKDAPYARINGYLADLTYAPDKENFLRRKVGDTITLRSEGEKYKIVAITQNEVVLSAEPSGKRVTIKLNPASP